MRALDPSLIAVEPYKELPVDRSGFIGPVPVVAGMEACDNFGALHGAQAVHPQLRACHSGLPGLPAQLPFGYQALADPAIRRMVEKVLSESRAGIVADYGRRRRWLDRHAVDLLHRLRQPRPGRYHLPAWDATRRASSARTTGWSVRRAGRKSRIKPEAISWGIAAALQFNPAEDPLAAALQKRLAQDRSEGYPG